MREREGMGRRAGARWARAAAAAIAAIVGTSLPAFAGPPDAPPPADATAARAYAVAHFENGLALYDRGEWAEALAELEEARSLYPLRNAVYQAGLCLEKLERFDEALERFEAMLREYGGSMPASIEESVKRKIVEMRARVGEIAVGGAEPGAAVSVDGLARGAYPLPAPLRVVAGSHVVRVSKVGFEPFEARVFVAGDRTQRVAARLTPIEPPGRVRIVEPSGKALRATASPPPPATSGGAPAWAWLTGGFGVAFAGAAIGFAVDGLGAVASLEKGCGSTNPDLCKPMPPGSYSPDADNARKNRDLALAIGLGAAGVAGIGATIARIAMGDAMGDGKRSRASSVDLLPIIGANVRGAVVSGSW
jgi:hypothetical protein